MEDGAKQVWLEQSLESFVRALYLAQVGSAVHEEFLARLLETCAHEGISSPLMLVNGPPLFFEAYKFRYLAGLIHTFKMSLKSPKSPGANATHVSPVSNGAHPPHQAASTANASPIQTPVLSALAVVDQSKAEPKRTVEPSLAGTGGESEKKVLRKSVSVKMPSNAADSEKTKKTNRKNAAKASLESDGEGGHEKDGEKAKKTARKSVSVKVPNQNRRCGNCGVIGHNARKCPSGAKGKEAAPAPTPSPGTTVPPKVATKKVDEVGGREESLLLKGAVFSQEEERPSRKRDAGGGLEPSSSGSKTQKRDKEEARKEEGRRGMQEASAWERLVSEEVGEHWRSLQEETRTWRLTHDTDGSFVAECLVCRHASSALRNIERCKDYVSNHVMSDEHQTNLAKQKMGRQEG